MKRVIAINDICCFGRCSLTYALPIISAAGIECSVLPTVVLSAHVGYPGFTFCDMINQFDPIINHLTTLNPKFDGILTGFVSGAPQIDYISQFIDYFGGGLTVVDPTMADDGIMYTEAFDDNYLRAMARLCQKASVIVPNLTEACFLTGELYMESGYGKPYIERLLCQLKKLGTKTAIVTGISFEENKIGLGFIKENGDIGYFFTDKSEENICGTGDIFASALTAAMVRGFSLEKAAAFAARYVQVSMEGSNGSNTQGSKGINFEESIPFFLKELKII